MNRVTAFAFAAVLAWWGVVGPSGVQGAASPKDPAGPTKTTPKTAPAATKASAPAAAPAAAPTVRPPKHWSEAELGGTKQPYAEVTRAASGKPIVAIHYPWQVHWRPSVEVRWMGDDEPDTAELRPLQFVASSMRGEIASAVFACRDRAAETPVHKTLKAQDRPFELHGSRNLLGKPAITIAFPAQDAGPDRPARAVFFLLESWAVDPRTLWLELPAEHFAERGRIRVWFYRGGDLVWWKTLAWPGTKP